MAQNKFVTWDALKMKLSRMKISNPGSLATLVLEAFLKDDGFIPSKRYYNSVFEVPGKNYTSWIHELKKNEILESFKEEDSKKSDWVRFKPGKVILPYINKEKIVSKEIATKDEVPSKLDVQDLKERMCKMEEAMTKVYGTLGLGPTDPPGYSKLVDHAVVTKVN
jgi:hypothetical protein